MQAGHRVRLLPRFLLYLALTLGFLGSAPATAFAVGQEVKPIPPNHGFAPLPHVEARLLFVYFPQAPAGQDSLLPAWSSWLVEELTEIFPRGRRPRARSQLRAISTAKDRALAEKLRDAFVKRCRGRPRHNFSWYFHFDSLPCLSPGEKSSRRNARLSTPANGHRVRPRDTKSAETAEKPAKHVFAGNPDAPADRAMGPRPASARCRFSPRPQRSLR